MTMTYKQLKLIDFSQGIKSSEVMHNDQALQEQIERERLAIAGSGVNFGLELDLIEEFKLRVTSGTIVDKNGVERYIKGNDFNIELPNLIMRKQRLFSKNNGVIELDDVPYSDSRTEPSQFASSSDLWGIDIVYEDSPATLLGVSSIKDKTIYTDAIDSRRAVIVTYNTAYDRIDTVYINDQYELKISAGIDSTTASAYIPEDCRYVLGFVKVVSEFFDENKGHTIAKASIIKEFNNRRTVYTDSNNNLYLCGVPFESLLRIYFEEPKEPKEGMLWYDMDTNKLKIWRRTDFFMFTDIITYTSIDPNNPQKFPTSVGYFKNQLSVYIEQRATAGDKVWTKLTDDQIEYYTDLPDSDKGSKESKEFRIVPRLVSNTRIKYTIDRYDDSYYWVPVNDTSYMSAFEYKIWGPSENGKELLDYKPGLNLGEMAIDRPGHDLQHFIFKADELHLRFTPNKNELNIIIDQIPLHRDQFVELTLESILNNRELTEMAINHYGYTTEYLQELRETYQDVGLGFKFVNGLDHPSFIEVDVQHRVNDSILKNKLQRNAAFSKSQTLVYKSNSGVSPYVVRNDDLIINTVIPYRYNEEQLDVYVDGKKIKGELITEITNGTQLRGAMCKSFSINTKEVGLIDGSEIIYKITTNVYSYDHVESAMAEAQQELQNKVSELESAVSLLRSQMDALLGN